MRIRWAKVVAAVAAMAVVGGCAPQTPAPESVPTPVLGWTTDHQCGTTADQVRHTADGLVDRGLRNAGYRTIFVVCDLTVPVSTDTDPALGRYLDERGLSLRVVKAMDPAVRGHVDATLTPPLLRTAMTRLTMSAAPIVFGTDPGALPQAQLSVVGNANVLALDQDSRGAPGAPILDDKERSSRAIGEQGLLVSLTNGQGHARAMSVGVAELGMLGDDTVVATDVWTGRHIKASDGILSISVGPSDTALLRIGV